MAVVSVWSSPCIPRPLWGLLFPQDRTSLGVSSFARWGIRAEGPSQHPAQQVQEGTLALDQAAMPLLSAPRLTGFPNELNHATRLHGLHLQFLLINDYKLLTNEPLGAAIINGWEWT